MFYDEQVGSKVTVANYFDRRYAIYLKDQNSVCVNTSYKKRTFVPIEMLEVKEKQRFERAFSSSEAARMIKESTAVPRTRAACVKKTIADINHTADETCQAFRIRVDKEMMTVRGRILPPPIMYYNRNAVEIPRNGVWNQRFSQRMCDAIAIHNWVIVNFSQARTDEIDYCISGLIQKGDEMGIEISMSKPCIFHEYEADCGHVLDKVDRFRKDRHQYVRGFPVQLVLVIMDGRSQVYNTVKNTLDLSIGIASQVILYENLRNRKKTVFAGVLKKITAKLGGTDCIPKCDSPFDDVPFAGRPHIVLGADVFRSAVLNPAGSASSTAALVGSCNPECTQFSGSIRYLPYREQVIVNIGKMFVEVYDRWLYSSSRSERRHAEAIILFRDGVSEGQFQEVLEVELRALRRECAKYSRTRNPRITYIVVTKRHHARFFPVNGQPMDRSGNCPPGTVVDTDVVSRDYYDFYLNSHASIKGTNRPAKYTVHIDENNIEPDALQAYAYRLAHGNARCNRAVSTVNVVAYANIYAERGHLYHQAEGRARTIKVPQALENTLYAI